MNLTQIINKLDKSDSNSACIDDSFIYEVLNYYHDICWSEEFEKRFKRYWIAPWLCTDTWVGVSAIFLDGEFIALCTQTARKNDKAYKWVDEDSINTARLVLLSMIEPEYPEREILTTEMANGDWGRGFEVAYASQILSDNVLYNGHLVGVVRENTDYKLPVEEWSKVTIIANGAQKRVNVDEIVIPYRVKD